MKNTRILSSVRVVMLAVGFVAFLAMLFPACTKNDNPQPPVHDTIYASKPDSTVNLAKGLELYLPFSGSIADSSGNNNPTTALNGAGLTADTHGYLNNAFGANGTNQVILVTNNGSIKFDTGYTVSLDFMTSDLSTRHCLLAMLNWSNGYAPSWQVGFCMPTNPSALNWAANNITAGCDNYGGSDPNKLNDSTSFVPVLGAWYNFIGIYHRGSVQVYINGKLIDQKTGTGTLANLCPASQIVIGGWWTQDPINLNGKMDNIRFYNRVITPHEIAALAANYQVTSTSVRRAVE